MKNNALIESIKRMNMAYLLLKDPQVIEEIEEKNAYFFHGTNANALPSILKYGINSVNKSMENNIEVTTGEEWTRVGGKRNFVSFTDSIDIALSYSRINPKEVKSAEKLLNFGVIIGASFLDMENIETKIVKSDIPEIGVIGNFPIKHIKFLAVPDDKVEFVKKMVGSRDIDVVSMDLGDEYYRTYHKKRIQLLENIIENEGMQYPSYSRDDIKTMAMTRMVSKIRETFVEFKERKYIKKYITDDKKLDERD